RGLREAGVLPDAGPGLAAVAQAGLDAPGMAREGLTAYWLVHTDPLRDAPERGVWDAALDHATTVVAHAAFLTGGIPAPEVDVSPSLQFLVPRQRAEMSPADAQRLGLGDGDEVLVGSNGTRVHATVALRAAVPPGQVFLQEGLDGADSANALAGSPTVEV